jgi:hypothetical protein
MPMLDATRWINKEEHNRWRIAYGIVAFVLLIATTWSLGHPKTAPRPSPQLAAEAPAAPSTVPPAVKKMAPPISGRRLTEERMVRHRAVLRHFSEASHGISFDSPRGYILKEGELPDMDTGLGYLGPIPMEFAEPGGVRVATIEVPAGAHPGTDLVNAFLTVSVFPDSTAEQCGHFSPELDQNQPALKRSIGGIDFTGIPNSEAADAHEYFGKYYHGYSEGACYEVGYGIVTANSAAAAGLKEVNADALLRKFDKIVDSISIAPQQSEADSAANHPAQSESKN